MMRCLVIVLFSLHVSGCSYFLVQGVPEETEALNPDAPLPCTDSYTLPLVDTALLLFGVPTLGMVSVGGLMVSRSLEDTEYEALGLGLGIPMILGGMVGMIPLFFAPQVGMTRVRECNKAKIAWRYEHRFDQMQKAEQVLTKKSQKAPAAERKRRTGSKSEGLAAGRLAAGGHFPLGQCAEGMFCACLGTLVVPVLILAAMGGAGGNVGGLGGFGSGGGKPEPPPLPPDAHLRSADYIRGYESGYRMEKKSREEAFFVAGFVSVALPVLVGAGIVGLIVAGQPNGFNF
jgi:hypothetical protein